MPRSRQIAPISAIRWIVPISLLASMRDTRTVSSVSASRTRSAENLARLLGRQVRHAEALALELPAGVEHGASARSAP